MANREKDASIIEIHFFFIIFLIYILFLINHKTNDNRSKIKSMSEIQEQHLQGVTVKEKKLITEELESYCINLRDHMKNNFNSLSPRERMQIIDKISEIKMKIINEENS